MDVDELNKLMAEKFNSVQIDKQEQQNEFYDTI